MKPARREAWRRARSRIPMTIALLGVAAVWVLGCIWSFTEQSSFATAHGFELPQLLALILDGLAASMGGVAYAASLDGRPAVGARLGTAVAVAASASSNGTWAAERSHDPVTIVVGVAVPIAANVAFEVLLGELRRQVQRARGLPAPAAIPTLRAIRLVLAPGSTFTAWRELVLDVTTPTATAHVPVQARAVPDVPAVFQEHPTPPPVHVPSVPAEPPVVGLADPPTQPIPPLWLLPPLPEQEHHEPVPASNEDVPGTSDDGRDGQRRDRYRWLIDAIQKADADHDQKRPTVRSVRADHSVSTDIAGWALREARA